MKRLDYREYLDKTLGCWLGKSVAGTIGAPYEGAKELLNVEYTPELIEQMLPNDDLDLPLHFRGEAARSAGEGLLLLPACGEAGRGSSLGSRVSPPAFFSYSLALWERVGVRVLLAFLACHSERRESLRLRSGQASSKVKNLSWNR